MTGSVPAAAQRYIVNAYLVEKAPPIAVLKIGALSTAWKNDPMSVPNIKHLANIDEIAYNIVIIGVFAVLWFISDIGLIIRSACSRQILLG